MLDDRKAAILAAIVEEYIDTAQPVGSAAVARAGVSASSATIRNEMAVLERDGYLAQPHTSAGRIPTDKGYRFFVDRLPEWGPGILAPTHRAEVRDFFTRAHGELEQMLTETSHLLSRMTDHTSVIVAPPHESATVRSLQIVSLGARTALVVVVFSTGAIDKHTIELPVGPGGELVDEASVAAAASRLGAQVVGHPLSALAPPQASGDSAIDALAASACAALSESDRQEPDSVFVGGAARMADAFEAVSTVRRVLGLLEEQFVVVSLVRDLLDRGLSVAIGEDEHGVGPLAECSIIVAPLYGEGGRTGSIGLLGPTRMDYQQAMAAVGVVSDRLGQAMKDG